jgi:hypothetical protein
LILVIKTYECNDGGKVGLFVICVLIQGDQNLSVHLTVTVPKKEKYSIINTFITEYIQNVYRAILNTVFENTDRRVNKCLETGGKHFEHYL